MYRSERLSVPDCSSLRHWSRLSCIYAGNLTVTMSGGIMTGNCSHHALAECSSQMVCSVHTTIYKSIRWKLRWKLWRVNALQVVEAVLAAVIVGIGAYGQRYRHHPITRFLFLGATTLFLPIISYLASNISLKEDYLITTDDIGDVGLSAVVIRCAESHAPYFVFLASLVHVVMINTSTIVSVDDREGQSKYPPLLLVVQGIWTFYLFVNLLHPSYDNFILQVAQNVTPYALLCIKIALKYYAFEKARRSVALGRNPGLVFVYMQQLQAKEAVNQHVHEPLVSEDAGAPPPPLLVMGESEEQVEKHPHGYAFKDDSKTTLNKNIGFVTTDRVWQLLDSTLPTSTPWLKDLCLSFALFKLLRCRFAGYKLTNSGSVGTVNFFQSLLLKAGEDDRVFEIITEELSFVHDYYYSSLPISYSKQFLPMLSIFLSLFTIGYCIFLTGFLTSDLTSDLKESGRYKQLWCHIWCINEHLVSGMTRVRQGELYLDILPLLFVIILVVTTEVRDMASYFCSNWTKVTLICHYINHTSSQYSLSMKKWVSTLLRCRCKLMKHWDGKMSQCSVLVPHPKTTPIVLVYRLLRVPDQRRNVKVPTAVKVSIINAVRNLINGHCLSNGAESLQRNQFGERFLWACNGKGTSDIILTWHIATCILEVKHPYRADDQEQGSQPNPSSANYKIAATHLSKYCAYLVSWCPELLPNKNSTWSQSLYKAVKKDADHALSGRARSSNPEDEYQKLVNLVGANSKHEVLKNGVKLGQQLAETINGEEMVWKLLSDFWSEMILYVAPSDNLKGHSKAIARGGELITLLWALLFHAGIVSRQGEEDGATEAPTAV